MCFPYDEEQNPPAPIAHVKITTHLPDTIDLPDKKAPVKKVRALLDTGSEISVLPKRIVTEIEKEWGHKLNYDFSLVSSLNGNEYRKAYLLRVLRGEHRCFNEATDIKFIIDNSDLAILGRNFLRAYSLVFDGPNDEWTSAESLRQANITDK